MSEKEMTTTKRLAQFAQREAREGYVKIDDILGLDVVVYDVEFREGDYGEYALFSIEDAKGNTRTVASGAAQVLDALHNAVAADALPVAARFAREGRRIVIL